MASYNRIVLMGNLTRDPQLSYTAGNIAVCKFGLATNHRRRDKDGNPKDEVCFVDCTCFGKAAETFSQYMTKGRPVLIEGRLQYQQWNTPEGDKRSKHEVIVENFQFVGGGRGGDAEGDFAGAQRAPVRSGSPMPVSHDSGYDSPPPPTDSDIPF